MLIKKNNHEIWKEMETTFIFFHVMPTTVNKSLTIIKHKNMEVNVAWLQPNSIAAINPGAVEKQA